MREFKSILKLSAWALVLLTAGAALGQESEQVLANKLVHHWQVLKGLSIQVAQAIPEKAYTRKASLAEGEPREAGPFELGSLAVENVLACSLAMGTPAPARFQAVMDHSMDTTKAGVMQSLEAAFDYCGGGLGKMKDADLLKSNARGYKGKPATNFDILWDAFGHAAHRLGKAELSLRLNGIIPPESGPQFTF